MGSPVKWDSKPDRRTPLLRGPEAGPSTGMQKPLPEKQGPDPKRLRGRPFLF